MSDPVTNAEVEDVLSSIRRLVSEDKRPLQSKQPVPANDRLVLTPALRVAEVHVEDVADDADDMGTDEAANLSDDTTIFDDPAHDYAADPYNFADEEDLDGDSDEAELLSVAVDEMDADLSDDVGVDRVDQEETIQESARNDMPDEGDAQDMAVEDEPASSPASLSAKIEALETAIGNISDTWEPDTPGEDDYSGTDAPAMAWEDDFERDATGTPFDMDDDAEEIAKPNPSAQQDEPQPEPVTAAASPAQDADDQDGFSYGSDDQLIDEEALRDLVSDIVRSELQGALGERITRNVRKLVRREIHRALAAQELE